MSAFYRQSDAEVPLRIRWFLAVVIGAATATVFWIGTDTPTFRSDFDQLWYGARAILAGLDPDDYVGPGRRFSYGFPFVYPLPAVLVVMPFSLLPLAIARTLFVFVSTATLAFLVTRDGLYRLPMFVSGAFFAAVGSVQWEILVTAMLLAPSLGWLCVAKPQMGLAALASTLSPRMVRAVMLGGGMLLALSFLLRPHWATDWLSQLQSYSPSRAPLLLPGGAFALLALLRWRRPEARLVVALACIPHTTVTYSALPLLLVARRFGQTSALAVLSLVVLALQYQFDARAVGGMEAFLQWTHDTGTAMVLLLYWPATLMVLFRPNEGAVPAWLARVEYELMRRVPGIIGRPHAQPPRPVRPDNL